MAKFAFGGLEEYVSKLSALGDAVPEVAGKAIYTAAGIVADQVRREIETLPVRDGYATSTKPARGVTKKGKAGLLSGLGITALREDNGYYHVKIGFDGKNAVKTKTYPSGQPNQLIARAAESGTCWLQPTPFVKPAVRKTKEKAVEAMQSVIDDECARLMK